MARRRCTLIGAAALLLAGCGGDAATPSVSPSGLVVDPLQYRADIAADRLHLQLTNGGDEQLALTGMQLR